MSCTQYRPFSNYCDRRIKGDLSTLKEHFIVLGALAGHYLDKFMVVIKGPPESHYSDSTLIFHVQLQPTYPFLPPRVEIQNLVFHPSFGHVDGRLNFSSAMWEPNTSNLCYLFGVLIPTILKYPNITPVMNNRAADLLALDLNTYDALVALLQAFFRDPTYTNSLLYKSLIEILNLPRI